MTAQKDQELTQLAGKIVKLLDEGVQRIDAPTSARLLTARKEALAHFTESPQHSAAPEWAMAAIGRVTTPLGGNLRTGLATGHQPAGQ
jgi:hypothetical protein